MGNDSNPKRLTTSATTVLGSVFMFGIAVNKTLTGIMTVTESSSVIAIFAATTTTPGTYHLSSNGVRYANLGINLATTDDVTVFTKIAS